MTVTVKLSLEQNNEVMRLTVDMGSRGVHAFPVPVERVREIVGDSMASFDIEHLIRNMAINLRESGLTRSATWTQIKTAVEAATFKV